MYHGSVYNFEVEEDNSYTVNGMSVHNCINKYPPRTADFSHSWAGKFEGFSSHFPHTAFARIAIREARSTRQPVYWLECHVTYSHSYDCLDRKVSIDFDELATVCDYGHRVR